MKYTTIIRIHRPLAEVIELFANTDNYPKWQEGLKSYTHLQGSPGEEGSTARMVYEGRKGDLVIEGTLVRKNPPDEYRFIYKSKGVRNEVSNQFSEPEPGVCQWTMVNIFRFGGLMALMAPFMKSAFAANTQLNMDRFKIFAEQSNSE